jgi:hypothetical protein
VGGWVRDLGAVWQAEQDRTRVEIGATDAYAVTAYETAAPPALAWEYVTSPARRPQWGPGISAVVEEAPAGRRGVGTTNHCIHGKDAILEEVLDWRPYDYWTTRSTMPLPGHPKVVITDAFIPLPNGGTRIETRIGRPKPRDRAAFERLVNVFEPVLDETAAALIAALAAEMARRADGTVTESAEPEVPASGRRFTTEPIVARAGTVESGTARSSSR